MIPEVLNLADLALADAVDDRVLQIRLRAMSDAVQGEPDDDSVAGVEEAAPLLVQSGYCEGAYSWVLRDQLPDAESGRLGSGPVLSTSSSYAILISAASRPNRALAA